MKKSLKAAGLCVFSALLFGAGATFFGCASTDSKTQTSKKTNQEMSVPIQENQFAIVVNGYDWGPGVDKIILNVGKEISSDEINAEDFSVAVTMPVVDWTTFSVNEGTQNRSVTKVYLSDENGTEVSKNTNFVSVELSVHPADGFSNPFLFGTNFMNTWANPYTVSVTNEKLGIDTNDCVAKISPLADKFEFGTHTADGITLSYASWEPENHGRSTPLIIWIHGMGEGGTDPYIPILGNKVVNLITPEIQNHFGKGGAYVLAPQVDGFWLQTDESKEIKAADLNPETPAVSYYTKSLFSLIEDYVQKNPSIDRNRIYIGGCSNGGYMTVNMLIEYPDYFAAAWPVCEAYPDSKIDDEKLEKLSKNHIWFTQAKNDTTVNPDDFDVATVRRLNEKYPDADIHFSFFDDVHDTTGLYNGEDGKPYQYMGHWSWLYALNNECEDNGVTLMEWLSKQSRPFAEK